MSIPLPARTRTAAGSPRGHGGACARVHGRVAGLLRVAVGRGEEEEAASKKGKTPSPPRSRRARRRRRREPESDEADSDEKASSKRRRRRGEEKEAANRRLRPSKARRRGRRPRRRQAAPRARGGGGRGRAGWPGRAASSAWAARRCSAPWAGTEDMGALAPYTLSPGPEVGVWLEAYPGRVRDRRVRREHRPLRPLQLRHRRAVEDCRPGMMLTTKYQDFLAGREGPRPRRHDHSLRGRRVRHAEVRPRAGRTRRPGRTSTTRSSARAPARAPRSRRPSIWTCGAGYLIVTNLGSQAGEIQRQLYPHATANGVDVNLSLGFRVTSMIGVRVGGDFRQYGLSLHRLTANTGIIAGGATDRYITVWGGVEIVLDGVGGGAAAVRKAKPRRPRSRPPKAKKAAPAERRARRRHEREAERRRVEGGSERAPSAPRRPGQAISAPSARRHGT